MKASISKFLAGYQRVTNSGKFIPEIDGLRFLAIASVILFHCQLYLAEKSNWGGVETVLQDFPIWNKTLQNGHWGVQLFFVISGFILGLPFAKHYLSNNRKPDLKDYFIRRITRLEPPYILIMVILFLAHLFIVHKYTIQELVPSLFASLTYTHNFFSDYNEYPLVNAVAWSLEIEIQFYILAPMLARMFSIKNSINRRIVITGIILAGLAAPLIYLPPFRSIYENLSYFLIGFLLVDFYLAHTPKKIHPFVSLTLGLLALGAIWGPDYFISRGFWKDYSLKILLSTSIFVLYYLTFFTPVWKKVFSIQFFSVVGGMCYSLYLIHYALISITGRFFVAREISSNYYFDWIIKTTILTLLIFICGAAYYKLVEQPCMQKDWYKKIFSRKKYLQEPAKKEHESMPADEVVS